MKVIKQFLDCLIGLIRINFVFILVLQVMKMLIGVTDVAYHESDIYANQSFVPSIIPAVSNSTSFLGYLKYLFQVCTSNSYDINLMEATKTEIINVYERPPSHPQNPNKTYSLVFNDYADKYIDSNLVTFKSFVNFTEFIQFNNLKNMVKLVFVLNLNLTTLIVNLIVVSFLITKKRHYSFLGLRFGRRFLNANLMLNLVLLIALLVLNTTYLLVFNGYFKSHNSISTLNNFLHDYIRQVFRNDNVAANFGPQLPNLDEYSVVELNSKLSTTIEFTGENSAAAAASVASAASSIVAAQTSGLTRPVLNDSSDRYWATLNVYINIVFTLFFVILLTFYSYFLNDHRNFSDNQVGCDFELDSDVEVLLKPSSFPLVVESEDVDFVKLKQKKAYDHIDFNILWIVHSLFLIYVLSIWDISDVYQYFKIQNWENSNLNIFEQAVNSPSMNFTKKDLAANGLIGGQNNIAQDLDRFKRDPLFHGSVSFINDYTNNYTDSFYGHWFQHSRHNQFSRRSRVGRRNSSNVVLNEEFKTTTTIRALVILKIHSKLLSCLLISLLSVLVLFRLHRIEKYLNLDFNRFLKDNLIFRKKFMSIDI